MKNNRKANTSLYIQILVAWPISLHVLKFLRILLVQVENILVYQICNEKIHDDINKNVIGKFNDELNGEILTEISTLNPKVYAFKFLGFIDDKFDKKQIEGNEHDLTELSKKKLKGVSKVVAKNVIKFEDYIHVLNTNKPKNVMLCL